MTSLLFGLLHLPSRFVFEWLGQTGIPLLDLAFACTAVLAIQGILGVLYGYLWTRYRNAWITVLLHTLTDTVPLLLILTGVVSTNRF